MKNELDPMLPDYFNEHLTSLVSFVLDTIFNYGLLHVKDDEKVDNLVPFYINIGINVICNILIVSFKNTKTSHPLGTESILNKIRETLDEHYKNPSTTTH